MAIRAIVRPHFEAIFEDELASWHTRERDWPAQRDLPTFLAWFEVHIHSMVIDMRSRWLIPTARYERY